ncbi:sodium- and chloride-dependent glycine transporter 1-like isoform X2 [Apostichopus japonicus]|uniref:sodium- and chloride-dependent glycine transporter 1-like isoform X2 n=1 Tax=Stichopus japonicus TaxID=307972 RepID=UPI003AB2D6A3
MMKAIERPEDDIEYTSNGKIHGQDNGKIAQTDTGAEEEDEDEDREKWGSWFDFILACIGYAVGLGNVWRFPYLCYENGGGAFLIPYIIMLFCCGLPLFFLELSFGQFASQGALSVWAISPLFRGVGFGMVIVSTLVAIYYNIIIAWTVYYGFKSFTFPNLEWISCNNTWNTEYCFDNFLNTTRSLGHTANNTRATEEFWTNKVHGLTDSIGDIGGMNWHLVGCLAASWIVVGLCISKGVKSSGKVVYFTAVFPFVVLIILFFRGITLPGAWNGIYFYIVPEFADLLQIKPWRDAATQIFYSLGISFGSLITFSSYNRFNNNCYRDALLVSLVNCGTSVFAGFVIFSTLGFMAENSGQLVKDVVDSGPGLAFIAYPEALARMPGAQFWSFLFFFMLFTLGLDSEFAMTETLITAVVDELPPHLKKWKPLVTISTCVLGFFAGLIMVTKSGLYIFTLMDWYSAGFSLMAIAGTYSLVISYIYGMDRFLGDIKSMIGFEPGWYWRISWGFVSPFFMGIIIICSFIFYTPAYYGDYVFPPGAEACGWIMTLASFLVIPGYMVYAMAFKAKQKTFLERLKFLVKPSKEWGPLLNKNRRAAGYPEHHLVEEAKTNGQVNHKEKVNYTAYSQDVQVSMPNINVDDPPPYPTLQNDKSYI